MPGSCKLSISLRFSHQNPIFTCPHPIRATYPAHFILVDLMTRIIFGEKYRSWNSSVMCF
jgi:hypothetical protein